MGRPDEARLRLREALEIARGQASPALELRTAVSFASSFGHDSPTGAARAMVGNAYARFTEGFETHDLATARELLTRL